MQAFDAVGQEVFVGDTVACTVGGSYYASSIRVGKVERVFQGTGQDSKLVKVSVSIPRKVNNRDGTSSVAWEKKPFWPKGKCVKMEGFDLDAYAANL
jgi:hypothetical protein